MKLNILIILSLFTWQNLIADTEFEKAINRFEKLATQSFLEDTWASSRRKSRSHHVSDESFDNSKLDSNFIREWYLRLGPAAVPLQLSDLDGVRRAELLDELLWALFQESVMGNIWDESIPWVAIQDTLKKYIQLHPLKSELFKQNNGAWWIWIAGENSIKAKFETPELLAFKKLIEARNASVEHTKLKFYFDALLLLNKNPDAFALVAKEFLSINFTAEIKRAYQSIYELNRKIEGAATTFQSLAKIALKESKYLESLDLRLYSLKIRSDLKEQLSVDDVKSMADIHYSRGEYSQALHYYEQAIQSLTTSSIQKEGLELRSLLAQFWGGQINGDNGYIVFEKALDRFLNTSYRDELMIAYATFLEKQKNFIGAIDLWQWSFQYSLIPENRLRGVQRSAQLSQQILAQQALSQNNNKLDWALRCLSYLKTWKQYDKRDPQLQIEIDKVTKTLQGSEFTKDASIRASLKELEL